MSEILNPLQHPIITGRPGGAPQTQTGQPVTRPAEDGASFRDLLEKRLQTSEPPKELTFSKHAQTRTLERSISLSQTDMNRLGQAVSKAEGKGLTDTLVYMNNTAFIVNVPNKVVVTVVDGRDTEDAVFTNIDGAVIV